MRTRVHGIALGLLVLALLFVRGAERVRSAPLPARRPASAALAKAPRAAALGAQVVPPRPGRIGEPQAPPRRAGPQGRRPAETALPEVIVLLKPGTDREVFARDHGLTVGRTLRSDPDGVIFSAPGVAQAAAARLAAAEDPRVRAAFLNHRSSKIKHPFVPNDPYYPQNSPPGGGFDGQWHLDNGFAPNAKIQILAPWGRDQTGQGVVVGMVDDGLQTAHPDLAANYDGADSFNFGTGTTDPNPVNVDDDHGTATSGLVAARGGNHVGVTGVAPFASVSCTRMDFNLNTDADFGDATQYHATGGSPAIKVKNHSYGDGGPYESDSFQLSALSNSVGAGVIHCFSAGNSRGAGDSLQDCNREALTSSPDSIVVAALGNGGTFANYSNFGAPVFVTTPSYDGGTGPGIMTTDRTGTDGYNTGDKTLDTFPDLNYTSTFGGTSASCPIAVGVLTLAKQIQPGLSSRLAKHLIVRSSAKCDPNDGTLTGDGSGVAGSSTAWKKNGAGYLFNQNYGFGLINADKLTQMALSYNSVTPLATETVGNPSANLQIPNGPSKGALNVSFTLNGTTPTPTPLEELLVTVNITHPYIGELQLTLTSPNGMTSRLVMADLNDITSNLQWTYKTNAFWGENPAGSPPGPWKLTVQDTVGDNGPGALLSWSVTSRMGSPVAAPFSAILTGPETANAGPIVYTVMFNQSATTPTAGLINVTNGTVASITPVTGANILISGSIYTIQVTPTTSGIPVTCQLAAGASTSGATPSPATGIVTTTYSTTAPVCTVSSKAATNQSPIAFDVTFSEPVSPLTMSSVQITNGTLESFSGSGTSYTVVVIPSAPPISVTVSVQANAVFDDVGNPNAAASSTTFYNLTPPATTITSNPPAVSTTNSATFTFTSSEAGSTFQVSLNGGTPTINSTGTVTFTNLPPGSYTVSIAAIDPAGNVDPTPAVYSWTIPIVLADTTAPLLNPFDTPVFTTHYTFSSSSTPQWNVDATPASVLGAPPFWTSPASLNYNNGVDDYSGGGSNNGTVTSNVISLNSISPIKMKFMCNYDLIGSETRTVNILASNLTTVQKSMVLSSTVDPGLGLCAAAGVWHEHTITLTSIPGLTTPLGVSFHFDTVNPVAATPASPGWFVDDLEFSDLLVSALSQYAAGGTVSIPVEGETTATSIDFRGIISRDAGATAVELDIEVQPIGTPFTGTPTQKATATSAGGPTPTPITVTVSLPLGSYHWQARTVSPPSTGTASHWMEFGLNATTDPDFQIVSPPVSGGGGGGGGCGASGLEGVLLALLIGACKGRFRSRSGISARSR